MSLSMQISMQRISRDKEGIVINHFLNRSLRLLILALGLTIPVWETSQADAGSFTYEFIGNISEVPGALFTPGGLGSNGFSTGLQFSGTYTFDPSTAGLLPSGLPVQLYNGSVSSLNFTIGNYAGSLQAGGTNLTIVSSGIPSLYSVNLGVAGDPVKGLAPSLLSINFADATGTAFTSAALPGNPAPSPSSFNVNRTTLSFTNGNVLVGSLSSLRAVPLPETWIFFGAGLIGLVWLDVRERCKKSRTLAEPVSA